MREGFFNLLGICFGLMYKRFVILYYFGINERSVNMRGIRGYEIYEGYGFFCGNFIWN